jgi:branched-chain amino acid aminotransferase
MKAYKDSNGDVRMFRPMMNMERMDSSMQRLAMPPLDREGEGMLCLKSFCMK